MRLRTLACHYRALVGPKPILTARQLIDPGQTYVTDSSFTLDDPIESWSDLIRGKDGANVPKENLYCFVGTYNRFS